MKKILSLALALVLCLSVLSASAQSAEPVLRVVAVVTSQSFNPLAYGNTDKLVIHSLFDYLFKFDNDGNVIPMLAESYEQNGMDVTVKMREDAVFSSGNPVKASDVKFAYETILEDQTLKYNMTMWCAGMEVQDDYTLLIHLANNYAKWINFLAELLPVVEEASYDPEANDYTKTAPVGSGAYTLVGQDASGTVTLAANENYWAGAPEWKTVEVTGSVDDATALIAMQRGEIDIVPQIGLATYNQAKNDPNLVPVAFDSWSQQGMMIFAGDMAFRQAVFHAIDRENILVMCNDGNGSAAENMFASKIMGEYAGVAPFTGFDPDLAAECLAKSETDLSQTFTIEVFDADAAAVAQCVQADLMMLGLNMEIAMEDANVWFDNLMAGSMQFGIAAMGTDMVGVEDMVTMFDPEAGYPFPVGEEMIQLAKDIPTIQEDEARIAATTHMLELMTEECAWVPLYDQPFYYVNTKRVGNVNDCSGSTYVFYFGDMTVEAN